MAGSAHAESYKDQAGEWRTRVVAGNGEPIFESGEGYKNRVDSLEILARYFPALEVVNVTSEHGDEDPSPAE